MTGRMEGKTCVITAAAAGIGRASAVALAGEGAQVIATDIDRAGLEALRAEHAHIEIAHLDVTSESEVAAFFDQRARIDVLFNCAGYVHQGSILDCPPDAWQRSIAVNLDAMYQTCRAALPGMVARGRGVILNMSSVASSVKGVKNRFAYSATKAGVIGLTKAIAADFVGAGIRCNAICPGTVETPSLAARVEDLGGDRERVWAEFRARQPMGRLGRAEEIAALVVYLASDEAAFTTGTCSVIDGGWTN